MSIDGDATAPEQTARHWTRSFYPIRVVTVMGGLLMGFLYTHRFGQHWPYSYAVAFVGLVYPHLLYYLQQRVESKRRIEHLTLLFDEVFAGSLLYLLSFSVQVSLGLALIALVTPIAFTGFALLHWTTLALIIGAVLPIWLFGMPLPAQDFPLLNYIAGGYVFAYFGLFANAVYVRARELQASRRALREQRLRAEIEQKRSESLVNSIIPPIAVSELRSSGLISAQARVCSICAVVLPHLARPETGYPSAAEAMDEITEILGSIDAICGRFGLEPINTTLDLYVAVGNLDGNAPGEDAAARAGREIAEWMTRFNDRRERNSRQGVSFGIAAGAGSLQVGAIQLRRLVYACAGRALSEAIQAARAAAERPAGADRFVQLPALTA